MNALLLTPEPVYLASPYTRYARGWPGAYVDICRIAAQIHRRYKIVVLSPISHCHGMTTHGDLPIIDGEFWKRFNAPFIRACGGCIVAKMDGWQESQGVRSEIADFKAQNKPVFLCDIETLELEQHNV